MSLETNRSRETGFTLLELLISSSLTIVIIGLCYQSIYTLNSARQKLQQQTALMQQKQLTHRTLGRLVADASEIEIRASEIKFSVISENEGQGTKRISHIIKLDGNDGRLLHIARGEQTLLLENISSIAFSSVTRNAQSNSAYSSQRDQSEKSQGMWPNALTASIKTDADSWRWQFNREEF